MSTNMYHIVISDFDRTEGPGSVNDPITLEAINTLKPRDNLGPKKQYWKGGLVMRPWTREQYTEEENDFDTFAYATSPISIVVTDIDCNDQHRDAHFNLNEVTLRESWPYRNFPTSKKIATLAAEGNRKPICSRDCLHVPSLSQDTQTVTRSECRRCLSRPARVIQHQSLLQAKHRSSGRAYRGVHGQGPVRRSQSLDFDTMLPYARKDNSRHLGGRRYSSPVQESHPLDSQRDIPEESDEDIFLTESTVSVWDDSDSDTDPSLGELGLEDSSSDEDSLDVFFSSTNEGLLQEIYQTYGSIEEDKIDMEEAAKSTHFNIDLDQDEDLFRVNVHNLDDNSCADMLKLDSFATMDIEAFFRDVEVDLENIN